jgi:TolB-like protein/Tfp pilus assembly protein PilF
MEVYKMEMPWENRGAREPELETRRIAVLPFVSMSPDHNDEYFADGLTEELIDRLCQVRELEVIARTSIMSYKKKEKKATEIGKELRAGALVEGSVRKEGNKVRVTAQLIDANTETHLWSSRYDRSLEGIFAVQSDIAEQVVDALKVRLLPGEKMALEKRATGNPDAYVLCLRGRHYWNEFTKEDNDKALKCYEEALKLDPTCALALAWTAGCYQIAGDSGWLRSEEAFPRTKEYARKALEIDPMLAEGHAALAVGILLCDWDIKSAQAEYRRAIELRPGYSSAHQWYAFSLMWQGIWDQAGAEFRLALELDPVSIWVNRSYGTYFLYKREYDLAQEQFKKVVARYPDSQQAHGSLLSLYLMTSSHEEFRHEFEIFTNLVGDRDSPYVKRWRVCLHAMNGEEDEARKLLAEIEESRTEWYVSPRLHQPPWWFSAFDLGAFHILLGDTDEGFEWLERAYQERDSGLLSLKCSWFLDSVRSDPRYLDLLKRLGLD